MSSSPSTEQLLVQVLARCLHAGLRALAEEAPDSRKRGVALAEVRLAFRPLWSRRPYVVLDFANGTVVWNGVEVLTAEEDEIGFADIMRGCGVYAITLVPGVEAEEIGRFLRVVDRHRQLDFDEDQDLITALFNEDLQYIRYTVGAPRETEAAPDALPISSVPVESEPATGSDPAPASDPTATLTLVPVDGGTDSVDEMEAPEERATAAGPAHVSHLGGGDELRQALRADVEATAPETRGVVELERFDSTLYFLDQNEIEYLRREIEEEYRLDHARSAVDLLLDILESRTEPGVRDEVIRVLTTLMPYLIAGSRLKAVGYLLSELRKIHRTTEFSADHKRALDSIRLGLSETRALGQLFYALDAGELEPTSDNIGALLRELRAEAIQTVLVWIGQIDNPEAKAAVVDAVDDFFEEWPGALSRMLSGRDRTAVTRALAIARKLKLPDFVDPVGEVLASDDPVLRTQAARTLGAISTAPSLKKVVPLIDDESEDVRKVVLQVLRARPYRGALTQLTEAMTDPSIERRDVGERRLLFEAYGVAAGPEGVSVLGPILAGKSGRPSSETRACAAVALGLIATPPAREALKRAAKDRDPVVRTAAGGALRETA